MITGALAGVRVLDFARVLAGPYCSMMLADLGAEVIKIEHPRGGDETRGWGPPFVGDLSAYFLSVNRGKRSVALDLKTDAGRATAQRLAAISDVVIENFKVGGMDALGLGYADLRALNPRLVYCSITGFGQTGAFRDRPGYDYVIQAMSGLMAITGDPQGEPQKVGVAICDVIAGLNAFGAILAALRHAERTGEGQHIDIALYDTALAALVNVAANQLANGEPSPRLGNAHPNIVPYQVFHASDQPFVLACGNDQQFAALSALIGQPGRARDPLYATNRARVINRAPLIALLSAEFAARPADHWIESLLAVGIPAGAIASVSAALDSAHTAERGMIESFTLANGATARAAASPLKLSLTPAHTQSPPPALGADTASVLRDLLNMSDSEIAALNTNL